MNNDEFTKFKNEGKKDTMQKNKGRKARGEERERFDFREELRGECCQDEMQGSFGDCDSFNWPKGPAMTAILEFGRSDQIFYDAYLKAWKIATENGWKLQKLS